MNAGSDISRVTMLVCVLLVVLFIGLSSTPVHAADAPGGGTQPKVYNDVMVFAFGRYEPRSTSPAPRGNGWLATIGGEREYPSGLRFGVDLTAISTKYNTPPISGGLFTVISDSMSLNILGASVGAAGVWRMGGVDMRAGASLGIYASRMTVYASTLGFPGSLEEKDIGFGSTVFLAMDFRTSPNSRFGLEARRLSLNADFGPLSIGRMAIGGNAWLLTYRHSFGNGGAF